MKKSINIHGISTTATYQEGDCLQLVNLRKKNGVHKPVTPRKTVRTTTQQYVYTFQHNLPQTGENLIGVRTVELAPIFCNYRGAWNANTTYNQYDAVLYNSKYYFLIANTISVSMPLTQNWEEIQDAETIEFETGGQLTPIRLFKQAAILIGSNTETILVELAGFKSITQIGNILNVLDQNGIKSLLWSDNKYILIDNNFGGFTTDTELLPIKVDLQVDGWNNAGMRKITRHYSDSEFQVADTQATKKQYVNGLFIKAKAYNNSEGRLTGYCLACTAVELYDGNYILQSQPILLGKAWDEKARYTELNTGSKVYDYNNVPAIYYPISGASEDVVGNSDKYYEVSVNQINAGTGNVSGTENIQTDKWGDICTLHYIKIDGGAVSKRLVVSQSSNVLKFRLSKAIDEKYRQLIKSVSIFITPETDLFDYVKEAEYIGNYNFNGTDSARCENYLPTRRELTDIIKELSDSNFYKVHEITFDELQSITPGTWTDIDLKDKLGDLLVTQELLPVDNFTHHNQIPANQFVYNSKLHIWDYKQELFHGWPFEYMQAQQGIGQFEAQTENLEDISRKIWIETQIKTQSGISKVVRISEFNPPYSGLITDMNSLLSYPDARAIKTTITLETTDHTLNTISYRRKEFKLEASKTHNYAYFISSDLKPLSLYLTELIDTPANTPSEQNRVQIYRNAMKVSSVNNPFYFPPDTTFTIGTGVLLNAGTNAQRMSEGQFGQYDLYVLTTEGLYSLDTGTTIAYNRQSPASLEIPTSDILCATPYGVVFVGKRGMYIINGQQTQLISSQIEENSQENDIYGASLSFITYLKTLKDILYDHNQNELIVVSSAHDYSWVLNLDSKMWYMSTEKIDYEIKNSSPNLLVVSGKDIKDYSQSAITGANIFLITRPIFFGIDEVKKLQRAKIRGRLFGVNTLENSNELFFRILGGNDGINNTLLRGFSIPANKQDRNYKDIDSGLFARSTFRNYSIALEATVDEQTEINYIDFEVSDDYKNDKMR